jgi:hypothetical protein
MSRIRGDIPPYPFVPKWRGAELNIWKILRNAFCLFVVLHNDDYSNMCYGLKVASYRMIVDDKY